MDKMLWSEVIEDIEIIYAVTTIVVIGAGYLAIVGIRKWCQDLNNTVPPHQQELRRLNAE
jgi:hypothetical protein